MGDGAIDVELVAASLRASSSDLKTFVEVLADKLGTALPGRVRGGASQRRASQDEHQTSSRPTIPGDDDGALESYANADPRVPTARRGA